MANVNDDDDREVFPRSDNETWIDNEEETWLNTFLNENFWNHVVPSPVDTGETASTIVSSLDFHRRPIDLDEPIWRLNLSVRSLKDQLNLVPSHFDLFVLFPNVRRHSLQRQLAVEDRMLQRLRRVRILLSIRYNYNFFPVAPLPCVPFDYQPFGIRWLPSSATVAPFQFSFVLLAWVLQ